MSTSVDSERPHPAQSSWWRQSLMGAVWCPAGMFLMSPLVAMLYQFPVLFNGKVVGIEQLVSFGLSGWLEIVPEVWFTLFLFGVIGGFPAFAVLGGVVGAASRGWFGATDRRLYWKTLGCALLVDGLIALGLALAADILAPALVLRS
jgi:hypothetical protein